MPDVMIDIGIALLALFAFSFVAWWIWHAYHQSKRASEFEATRRRIAKDIENGTRLTRHAHRHPATAAPIKRDAARNDTTTSFHHVASDSDGRSYRRVDAADLIGEVGAASMQMQWAAPAATPEHDTRMQCSNHISNHDSGPSFTSCDTSGAAPSTVSCAPSCD